MEAPPLPSKDLDGMTGSSLSQTSMMTMSSEDGEEKKTTTNWKSIALATFITFLCSVENNVIGMGEWPYMTKMDPHATSSFFGFVTSVCRFGHAIFAVFFALIAHKWHVTKIPLLIGRFLALFGCLLYLMIEYVPHDKRYAMLFCYFLFGIGFSTSPLLRSYVARMSSSKSRTSAYALFNAATIFSVILGPMAQLSFSGIAYPGFEIAHGMNFHIYSAPIWIALITNIIAIFVVWLAFDDPPTEKKLKKSPSADSFSMEKLKAQWLALKSAPFNWSLVFLVLFQKMISTITICTLQATASPMMMSVFAFTGPTTVKIMAVSQFCVGILALVLSCLFVFGKLGKKISSRVLYSFSTLIIVILYITSYPWPPVSQPMLPFNVTTRSGCNPNEYSWCETAQGCSPWVWLPILILVMGFAFPSGAISLDTIYSRVLGNIDQSLMQGFVVVAEDLVLVLGPLYAANMFTAYGMGPLWAVNGVIVSFGLIVWFASWKKLKPYC